MDCNNRIYQTFQRSPCHQQHVPYWCVNLCSPLVALEVERRFYHRTNLNWQKTTHHTYPSDHTCPPHFDRLSSLPTPPSLKAGNTSIILIIKAFVYILINDWNRVSRRVSRALNIPVEIIIAFWNILVQEQDFPDHRHCAKEALLRAALCYLLLQLNSCYLLLQLNFKAFRLCVPACARAHTHTRTHTHIHTHRHRATCGPGH